MVGDSPHLIDEWQEVPQIWDSVRSDLDSHPGHGRYILTGSSVPRREEYIHSGIGRIAKLKMRTMTLFETGDSDGSASLRELMLGKLEMSEKRDVELEQLVDFVVRGGWPAAMGVDPEDYGLIPREYIESAIEDACRLDGKRRDREKMTMLIKSLSRNESTVVSNETVKNGMRSYDDESISNDTYYDYSDFWTASISWRTHPVSRRISDPTSALERSRNVISPMYRWPLPLWASTTRN